MKKLIKLISCMIIFIYPHQVLACPHIDKKGDLHFQFYNEDYTEMTMLYPRENYLFTKVIPILEQSDYLANENDIITEAFGFPMAQDADAYWSNYWFSNPELLNQDWQDLDLKLTVEGIDEILVNGDMYTLEVGLKNTYLDSKKYINDEIFQMYYNIILDKITNENKDNPYLNLIKKYNLKLITSEIFDIKTNISIINKDGYDYEYENISFNKLLDDIYVQIKSEVKSEHVKVINLSKLITEDDIIETDYDETNKVYSFKIEEPGVYAIVEDNFNVSKLNQDEKYLKSLIGTDEKNSNNEDNITEDSSNQIIFILITVLVTVGTFLIIVKVLKKDKIKCKVRV